MPNLTLKAMQRMSDCNQDTIYIDLIDGGCAGFMYTFSFVCPRDCVKFKTGEYFVAMRTDQMTQLEGVEIDFESTLMRKRFIVKSNPYEIKKCGCGISFIGRSKV